MPRRREPNLIQPMLSLGPKASDFPRHFAAAPSSSSTHISVLLALQLQCLVPRARNEVGFARQHRLTVPSVSSLHSSSTLIFSPKYSLSHCLSAVLAISQLQARPNIPLTTCEPTARAARHSCKDHHERWRFIPSISFGNPLHHLRHHTGASPNQWKFP